MTDRPQLLGRLGDSLRRTLRALRPLLTPFNVVSGAVILAAAAILAVRFTRGLGSVTNLSQEFPWGLWIGFDVVTGVAFAGGGYVITFLVYVLRVDKYKPIVRATVLNGLLAYIFYAGALLLDLGRPWKVVNPIIGNSFGYSSVLFLVAWHFLLYMLAQAVEFSPTVAEWLGLHRARRILAAATAGAVIFGITLSLLHQSGLGALYLMAKPKIHPLWYTEFIPILFLVSSVFAGLSLVVVEGSITQRVFAHRVSHDLERRHEDIVFGLARICAATMFVYLFMLALTFVHGQRWVYLHDGWGAWYLFEVLGLVAVPLALYARGLQRRQPGVIRAAAGLTLLGVVVNRLNVSVIAFKWYAPRHYVPTVMEVVVTCAVVLAEIWVFRWIVNRMPVLGPNAASSRRSRAVPRPTRPAVEAQGG